MNSKSRVTSVSHNNLDMMAVKQKSQPLALGWRDEKGFVLSLDETHGG